MEKLTQNLKQKLTYFRGMLNMEQEELPPKDEGERKKTILEGAAIMDTTQNIPIWVTPPSPGPQEKKETRHWQLSFDELADDIMDDDSGIEESVLMRQTKAEILEKARVNEFAGKLIKALNKVVQSQQETGMKKQLENYYDKGFENVKKITGDGFGASSSSNFFSRENLAQREPAKVSKRGIPPSGMAPTGTEFEEIRLMTTPRVARRISQFTNVHSEMYQAFECHSRETNFRSDTRYMQTTSDAGARGGYQETLSGHFQSVNSNDYALKLAGEAFPIGNPPFGQQGVQTTIGAMERHYQNKSHFPNQWN